MSRWKSFGLSIFTAVCLLGETVGSAHAQCSPTCATEWSGGGPVNLGGLPGATYSIANGINDVGQAVGSSAGLDFEYAVEWSGGRIINLGGLPGSLDSVASSINNAGQVVGVSYLSANGLTPPSGAAAASSICEAYRDPSLAPPPTSTIPVRRWEEVLSARRNTPSSGAAAM